MSRKSLPTAPGNPEERSHKPAIDPIFEASHFTKEVGIVLLEAARGRCRTELTIETRHLQHSQVVHAGVLATMADQTAGGAAYSTAPPGTNPLTIEFKLNLLRPAAGQKLVCEAEVLKSGRLISVVESEVWAITGDQSKLVAKATVTIANA